MEIKIDKLGKVAITVEKDYWSPNRAYDRLVIVEERNTYITYISRKPVPPAVQLTSRDYWIPLGKHSASISVKNFILIASVDDLPATMDEVEGPYMHDGVGYFWVGEGGDTLDGKYQR